MNHAMVCPRTAQIAARCQVGRKSHHASTQQGSCPTVGYLQRETVSEAKRRPGQRLCAQADAAQNLQKANFKPSRCRSLSAPRQTVSDTTPPSCRMFCPTM